MAGSQKDHSVNQKYTYSANGSSKSTSSKTIISKKKIGNINLDKVLSEKAQKEKNKPSVISQKYLDESRGLDKAGLLKAIKEGKIVVK